jgi:tetratricopeptide (TPR) repeat protein
MSQPFFAMEYVRGARLDHYLQNRSLDTRQRLQLLARVCDAVHHAHLQGVIHRDLKPGNILIEQGDSNEGGVVDPVGRPRVLDFGVARVTESDVRRGTLQTEVGQILGTLPFMSPEQVVGDPAQVDARSDVYALGVIGHWLLAGRLPHDLERVSLAEAARIIQHEEPARPSSIDRSLRGDVETILLKAVDKDRELRYQSASELAADIRRHLADEPITARPPSAMDQLRKFARRNRTLVGAAGALLAVIVAAGLVAAGLALRAARAERLARDRLAEVAQEKDHLEAVSAFLQEMVASADPSTEGGGRNVTVREVLDRAIERLDEGQLGGQPRTEARLRRTLGNAYSTLGAYEKARPQLARALEIQTGLTGDSARPAIEIVDDLATTAYRMGDFEAARDLLGRELDLARIHLGPRDRQVVVALTNLTAPLTALGKHSAAESLATLGLELAHRVEGGEGELAALNLNTLALLRW